MRCLPLLLLMFGAICAGGVFAAPDLKLAPFTMPAQTRPGQAERWTRADANADGSLTRDEARRFPRLARQFEVIDRDSNGELSAAEVRAWRQSRRTPRPAVGRKGVDELLKRLDRNGDGLIGRAEIGDAPARLARRFEHIDRDGDAQLSREELAAWLESLRPARRSDKAHQQR